MRFPYFRYAASLFVAAGIFAGCSGGGKSLVQAPSQQSVGQSVPVTFTVTIGSQSQTQSTKRSPQYIPSSTQSIVIDYIGDNPNATPAPAATPPANVTTAATVNVTATTTNPPPAGECFASNGTYTCTISLKLPVGILDLYVLAYAGQNGTGLLLAGNVVIAQVNANGTVTQPGSSSPISIALVQKGAILGTATLGAIAQIVPNGLPKPGAAAPSYPTNSAPYVYSAAGSVAVANPSGTPIPVGTPIQAVTITDSESGGASCLVYIPNGSTTATPCPFATSASSVTLSTSGDSYAVLYNGRFAPAATLTISASFIGASPTPAPIAVAIQPTIFSAGSVTLPSTGDGPIGSAVYDSTGKNVYVGTGNPSTPLYKVAYSSSAGYGAPSPVNVTSVNGVAASNLSSTGYGSANGGVNAMVLGPDNNLWIVEHGEHGSIQYVAVAVINSAVVNPITGGTISPGSGVFAEYALFGPNPSDNGAGPLLKGITSMGGYIWVLDKDGDLWRINPTNGLVNPNLAAGYLPGQSSTQVSRITNVSGTLISQAPGTGGPCGCVFYSALIPLNGILYFTDSSASSFDALSVDTSATPSAGICTTPGPPPCIATFTRSLNGSVIEPYGSGTTDGTSYYSLNDDTGNVQKITPPSTLSNSTAAYTSYSGGLGISADGWIWTLSSSGVQALLSMTSSATPVSPAAVSACSSTEDLERGAFPFVAGPDSTWLFSPNYSDSSSSTAAMLCAVVY
jgi:hypothetical protein